MHVYGNKQDVADGGGVVLSLILTGTAEEVDAIRAQLRDAVSLLDGHGMLGLGDRRFADEPLTVLEQVTRTIIEAGSVAP